MNGIFLIDGLNSLDTFGMIVSLGGYRNLACFAATKDVKQANFKEVDGITADLSEKYLKNKTVKINFSILANRVKVAFEDDASPYRRFLRHISDKSYHDYTFI
jgi:hypothetical protein